jgi:hypothetical protein
MPSAAPPADLDEAGDPIAKVGELLVSHLEIAGIAEIDLNPVAASARGCVAPDARGIVTTTAGEEGAA